MLELILPFLIPMISGVFFTEAEEYYTLEDFLKVRKIDTHTHHNSESTALAEAGIESNFFLLTVNVDAPSYPELHEQLRLAVHQKSKNPEHIDFLSTISLENWKDPDWADKEIARIPSKRGPWGSKSGKTSG
jgi:hypothetical protein